MAKSLPLVFLQEPDIQKLFIRTQQYFSSLIDKFAVNHYLARRIGLVAIFIALFGLTLLILKAYSPDHIPLAEGQTLLAIFQSTPPLPIDARWFVLGYVGILTIILILNLIIPVDRVIVFGAEITDLDLDRREQLINAKKHLLMLFVYFLLFEVLIAIFIIPWNDLAPNFVFLGGLTVISSFSINRKMGFTRAWGRYRLALQRLQVLQAQYKLVLIDKHHAQQSLLILVEQACTEAYQDITSDRLFERLNILKSEWQKR